MGTAELFGIMVLGIVCHFCKEMGRIKLETGRVIHPLAYFKEYPYQTVICICASTVLFFSMHEAAQLNTAVAFGCGWIGNSAADVMGKRAERAL